MHYSRRDFLSFLGISSTGVLLGSYAMGCRNRPLNMSEFNFKGLPQGLSLDKVTLVDGLNSNVILRYGDAIGPNKAFGFNNDYIAFLPAQDPKQGLLWVNHEYTNPLFIHGVIDPQAKTQAQVEQEMKALGGSIVHISQDPKGHWSIDAAHPDNHRITGLTQIPLVSPAPIEGSHTAMGTFANCAGGVTPWGTVLTCEENYQDYYGERIAFDKREIKKGSYNTGWDRFYQNPPEHYGWVVEVDAEQKSAKKLTALGRFSHEGATCVQAKDGRTVVYMGDDKADECIYKFISKRAGSLEEGVLYVADTSKGSWVELDREAHPVLKEAFQNQTQLLTWARQAAKLVGGTPQHRPEDIEINPNNGDVLVALTNHKSKEDFFGSILKIKEHNGDHLSLSFASETFITGGPETGFAAPDNLTFDPRGNLWITTDISGSSVNKTPYSFHGNNGLFVVPVKGSNAGKAVQVASAPHDAEFTGPCFSPDGKTLFLSVQHPGEGSKSLSALTSNWPDGGDASPAPSIIAITGPVLEELSGVKV